MLCILLCVANCDASAESPEVCFHETKGDLIVGPPNFPAQIEVHNGVVSDQFQ